MTYTDIDLEPDWARAETGGYRDRMRNLRAVLLLALLLLWAQVYDPDDPFSTLDVIGDQSGRWVTNAQGVAADNARRYLADLARVSPASLRPLDVGLAGFNERGVPIGDVTGAAAARYAQAMLAGADPETAAAAAQAYLNRIAATEPFRVANQTVSRTATDSTLFTGRWRRVTNRGACPACVALAARGWTDYDAVAEPAHPNCGCTIEPEVRGRL